MTALVRPRTASHAHPAAWVDGEPVDSSEVDAELVRLRSGPRAALLPVAGSSEGRQLRRWVAQTLVTRQLLEHEAAERRLEPATAPAVGDVLPDRAAAMSLGGVVASVLRASAPARAVYADVVQHVSVTQTEVRAYLARNPRPVERAGEPASSVVPDGADRHHAHAVLTQGRRRQSFLDWLSQESSTRIRLELGFEHPGDPHQPDATHRH